MSTFRCSSPCYHHKRRNLFIFHPMTNVTIIPSFIQKSFLSVIYSPRLINFSHFSSPCYWIETNILRYHTTWRLTEYGDYRLEMPNSIPSSPCIEPLVNSNKQKQLPASSLQSFTAMSARGLFLSKLERRLQCQITHRYTQSWGHKRELTQRITARCEEYTASSPQLQLSAPRWMRKVASQFYVLLTPKKQRSLSLTNQQSAILALFCSNAITAYHIKKSHSSLFLYISASSHPSQNNENAYPQFQSHHPTWDTCCILLSVWGEGLVLNEALPRHMVANQCLQKLLHRTWRSPHP